MKHPDEGTIHAWLDEALPADEATAIATHVAGCAECAASVAGVRGFIAAASRIVSALDDIPRGVLPQRETMLSASRQSVSSQAGVARTEPARASVTGAPARPWWARPQLAAAALLAVVAGSVYTIRGRDVSVRERSVDITDSAMSGPALAPSLSATPEATAAPAAAPAAAAAAGGAATVQPSATMASARRAQQNAPAADAASRSLSERFDARREVRTSQSTMSAPMSAPAAASAPTVTSPILADSANAPELRKSSVNAARGAAGTAAQSTSVSQPPAAPKALGAETAASSVARIVFIAPGCYATRTAGLPPRIVLVDSLVAIVNGRVWQRARPWPATAQNTASEWRWAPLEANTAELLSIVRGDTTRYRLNTSTRDASGCRQGQQP